MKNDYVYIFYENHFLLSAIVKAGRSRICRVKILDVLLDDDLENDTNISVTLPSGVQKTLPNNVTQLRRLIDSEMKIHFKHLLWIGHENDNIDIPMPDVNPNVSNDNELQINDRVFVSEKGKRPMILKGILKLKTNDNYWVVTIKDICVYWNLGYSPNIDIWETYDNMNGRYNVGDQIHEFPSQLRQLEKMRNQSYYIKNNHLTKIGVLF